MDKKSRSPCSFSLVTLSVPQVPGAELQHANAAIQKTRDRDTIIDEYDAELKEAQRWALCIGILHTFSKFLAFCNLTWATVALLGAFLPDLSPLDFGFVSSLLFIEAGRLASASFFLRLVMRPLAYGSQNPKNIPRGEDAHYVASVYYRQISHVVQLALIAPGFVLPSFGHVRLQSYSGILNLNSSLRIFYSFVAFNSLVALINVICSIQAFKVLYKPHLKKPQEQSILKYFNTVLERAISSGDLLQADVFEFFSFAYTMLGADFRRQMPPKSIAENHKRLIEYLYWHRLGLEAIKTYLEAEDPFVQLAAVNMVGFWCNSSWPGVGVPEEERMLPEELLTKLADKVGMGQLGWAATTSFGVLASTPKGARIMAGTGTSSNVGLPDRLVNLVDDSSSRSLSLVRTLVRFYEQYCVDQQQPPRLCEQEDKLVAKLGRLAREGKVHRLRVLAAYLLLLMGKRSAYDSHVVLAIDPGHENYWFTSEIEMLHLLRSHIPDTPRLEIPKHPKNKPLEPFEQKDDGIKAPHWVRCT